MVVANGEVDNAPSSTQKFHEGEREVPDGNNSSLGNQLSNATSVSQSYSSRSAVSKELPPSHYMSTGPRKSDGLPPGVVGLLNMGNSCFMNSILQCLFIVNPFAQYLATYETERFDRTSSWGTMRPNRNSLLTEVCAKLFKSVWSGNFQSKYLNEFRDVVNRYEPKYGANQPQDALEFLLFLLNTLSDELKLASGCANPTTDHSLKEREVIVESLFRGYQLNQFLCPNPECERYEPLAIETTETPKSKLTNLKQLFTLKPGQKSTKNDGSDDIPAYTNLVGSKESFFCLSLCLATNERNLELGTFDNSEFLSDYSSVKVKLVWVPYERSTTCSNFKLFQINVNHTDTMEVLYKQIRYHIALWKLRMQQSAEHSTFETPIWSVSKRKNRRFVKEAGLNQKDLSKSQSNNTNGAEVTLEAEDDFDRDENFINEMMNLPEFQEILKSVSLVLVETTIHGFSTSLLDKSLSVRCLSQFSVDQASDQLQIKLPKFGLEPSLYAVELPTFDSPMSYCSIVSPHYVTTTSDATCKVYHYTSELINNRASGAYDNTTSYLAMSPSHTLSNPIESRHAEKHRYLQLLLIHVARASFGRTSVNNDRIVDNSETDLTPDGLGLKACRTFSSPSVLVVKNDIEYQELKWKILARIAEDAGMSVSQLNCQFPSNDIQLRFWLVDAAPEEPRELPIDVEFPLLTPVIEDVIIQSDTLCELNSNNENTITSYPPPPLLRLLVIWPGFVDFTDLNSQTHSVITEAASVHNSLISIATRLKNRLIDNISLSVIKPSSRKNSKLNKNLVRNLKQTGDTLLSNRFKKRNSELAKETRATYTLFDCLKGYVREQHLEDCDDWICLSCDTLQPKTRTRLCLIDIPDYLFLYFKRIQQCDKGPNGTTYTIPILSSMKNFFLGNSGNYSMSGYPHKNEKLVDFPIRGLDLGPFVPRYDNANDSRCLIYDLIAVCNHLGSLNCGHYTAYCLNPVDGKWRLFNDTSITIVSEEEVLNSPAYLVLYQRRQSPEETLQPLHQSHWAYTQNVYNITSYSSGGKIIPIRRINDNPIISTSSIRQPENSFIETNYEKPNYTPNGFVCNSQPNNRTTVENNLCYISETTQNTEGTNYLMTVSSGQSPLPAPSSPVWVPFSKTKNNPSKNLTSSYIQGTYFNRTSVEDNTSGDDLRCNIGDVIGHTQSNAPMDPYPFRDRQPKKLQNQKKPPTLYTKITEL